MTPISYPYIQLKKKLILTGLQAGYPIIGDVRELMKVVTVEFQSYYSNSSLGVFRPRNVRSKS
jgi:hypothetical protein